MISSRKTRWYVLLMLAGALALGTSPPVLAQRAGGG